MIPNNLPKNSKYFVGGQGDEPNIITFSWEKAEESNDRYIDIFDEKGNHIMAYKRIDNHRTELYSHYTSDF